MNILYVITKATRGGAQQYVFDLATAAKAAGHEVAVAYGVPGHLLERLAVNSVPTFPVGRLTRDIGVSNEAAAFWALLTLLRKLRPDVVHLNSSKAGGLGALAARIAGVRKIIFTAHGWPHKEPRGPLAQLAIWLLSWLTIFLCHEVIVVSENDYVCSPSFFSKKKIRLVRNGIETFSLLPRDEARSKLSERVGHPIPQATWVMSVAELHRNKGIDLLVSAFGRIAPTYPDTHLVVLSDGEEFERLESLTSRLGLNKRVTFAGFTPDARSYLSAADFFALPSRKEGLPFALLEAGLSALPTIVTNVGGMPEVVIDGKNGFVVQPEDVSALATALEKFLVHPDEAAALGKALRVRVTSDFSKDEMIRKTLEVYAA